MEKEPGWKQVYMGSGAHLERVLEMYQELGYETRLEPLAAKETEVCPKCFKVDETIYRLYIKEKGSRSKPSSFE